MDLDRQVCSRARLSRDPRFDGKFFVAVLSTRIYCRPICRARTCKENNVRYYLTAAAAAEAGFRPCLRCRPECSPGTPAWLGTSNTVSRALRLIGESGLEDGGIESLAERLGVGSRHLRRLFVRHLGATPSAVAQTRRLHFAKKLIDETSLPMNQLALAAGFGCVRRFNAAIRDTYKRTPTQLRCMAGQKALEAENQYVFHLRFRPPYNWHSILAFLSARAIPGVEAINDNTYHRSICINNHQGQFEVFHDEGNDALVVGLRFGDPDCLYLIIERIRRMFDLDADWSAIADGLRHDPELAAQMEAEPGLRVPGCWDGFELTIRAILGQQVTVKGATTLAGVIARSLGKPFFGTHGLTHCFPTPQVLATANLVRLGVTRAKARAIRSLARAVCEGHIGFQRVIHYDELLARLTELPGIGSWTSQYVAMRALGEPDAFPTGDLGLLRALGLRRACDLEHRAEAWRPWRAYAAMYLWSMAGNNKLAGPDLRSQKGSKDVSAADSTEGIAAWM